VQQATTSFCSVFREAANLKQAKGVFFVVWLFE